MPFEDLDVWKRATRLSAEIYRKLTDLKDYGFRDHRGAGGSAVFDCLLANFSIGIVRDGD